MHNGIRDLPVKSLQLEFKPELSLMKYSCRTRPTLVCCRPETGMWAQTISSQVSRDTEFIITRWSFGSPGVGAGCQGNFIWEGTPIGKPTAAVCLQQECRDRTGLVGFIRSALALCTWVCDALVPEHLSGNKHPQARQSYLTIQSACKRPTLAIEPKLASFVPEAVLSKRKREYQHCYSKAKLLEGNSSSSEHPGRAIWHERISYAEKAIA